MAENNTTEKNGQNKDSILSKIQHVQGQFHSTLYRVEVLEKALATREMTIAEREIKEAELEAIKRQLINCEDMLKLLQKQNRHTPSVAGLFIFLCLFIFLAYSVMTNTY